MVEIYFSLASGNSASRSACSANVGSLWQKQRYHHKHLNWIKIALEMEGDSGATSLSVEATNELRAKLGLAP